MHKNNLTSTGMTRMNGKLVRDTFFHRKDALSDIWTCKCGTTRKAGRGYTNFVSHVQALHVDDLGALLNDDSHVPSSTNAAISLFYSKKPLTIHEWLDFVVAGLEPFAVVENQTFIRLSKFDPISYKTLMKYMSMMTRTVETKISSELPE